MFFGSGEHFATMAAIGGVVAHEAIRAVSQQLAVGADVQAVGGVYFHFAAVLAGSQSVSLNDTIQVDDAAFDLNHVAVVGANHCAGTVNDRATGNVNRIFAVDV